MSQCSCSAPPSLPCKWGWTYRSGRVWLAPGSACGFHALSSLASPEIFSTLNIKRTYISFQIHILFIHLTKCLKQIDSPRKVFLFYMSCEVTLHEALVSTLKVGIASSEEGCKTASFSQWPFPFRKSNIWLWLQEQSPHESMKWFSADCSLKTIIHFCFVLLDDLEPQIQ